MNDKKHKALDRVLKQVFNTEDCIETNLPLNGNGYVEFQTRIEGKKIRFLGHRLIYEHFFNIVLTSENIVCHKCDNPKCLNPKHLFLGTHIDNMKDKFLKGRQAKGKKNGRYKNGYQSRYDPVVKPLKPKGNLSSELVQKIKEKINEKDATLKEIAKLFDIEYHTIRDISCGRVYKNI